MRFGGGAVLSGSWLCKSYDSCQLFQIASRGSWSVPDSINEFYWSTSNERQGLKGKNWVAVVINNHFDSYSLMIGGHDLLFFFKIAKKKGLLWATSKDVPNFYWLI